MTRHRDIFLAALAVCTAAPATAAAQVIVGRVVDAATAGPPRLPGGYERGMIAV